MKKIVYLCAFLLGNTLFAQEAPLKVEIVKNTSYEDAEAYGSQEIRFHIVDLLLYSAISLSYEKVPSVSNAYGASVFLNTGDAEYPVARFSISPYYRFYFFNRNDFGANGFFAEIFSSFALGEEGCEGGYDCEDETLSDSYFDMSLGATFGRKRVNRQGFTFETYIGVGRYLFSDNSPGALIRFGLSLGKRF